MKKQIFLFVIPVVFLISSCGNSTKKQLERLQQVNDSLMATGVQKDTTLLEYIRTFNEIQANLDSIKMKENIITQTTSQGGEIQTNVKNKINNDVNSIYDMLKKNRALVEDLRKKINQKDANQRKADAQLVELQKMIDNYSKQLESKNIEVNSLKEQLNRMNIQIVDLNKEVSDLSQNINQMAEETAIKEKIITEKIDSLNTAYYIIGTKDELKEMGVINRTGGFLGIGRNNELNDNFNLSTFTKININNLTEIPVYKNNVEVLSFHPAGSYNIVKDGSKNIEKIEIVNPKLFWSTSKYLIVVTK